MNWNWKTFLLAGTVLLGLGCSSAEEQSSGWMVAEDTAGGVGPSSAFGLGEGLQADSSDGVGEDSSAAVSSELEKCIDESDCEAGQACDCAGACVAAEGLDCVEDKNCGSGSYCDLCIKHCFPLKTLCAACGTDNECEGTGSKCVSLASGGNVCGLGCLSDVTCPQGFACTALGEGFTSQCMPVNGICEETVECTVDGDCAFPLICGVTGSCVAGCPEDSACPDGQVCEAGHCVPACDGNGTGCPADKICKAGHCTVEGGCIASADCPEPETYCDLVSSTCVSGCQVDGDCKSSGKQCAEGSCIAKGCTANFFCAFGEVCDLATGQCVIPPEPHCSACDAGNDSSCAPAAEGATCLEFQDENGSSKGGFCLVPCGADPANPCPQGYACQPVEVSEGVEKPLCLRDCGTPPL